MGFNRDGGYGQYELVHENILFPVPDEFSPTEATLLLDVMGTGGHAIERCQLMRPDIESLLVVGAGPIGLSVLAMAKIVIGQQLKVLITDFVSYRVKLAERLGGLPIEACCPTLLLDKADTFVDGNEELRGILNSGHTRDQAYVIRCNPVTLKPERFSVWCPKSIALIGSLPGTLADRSIEIRMERKTRGQKVSPLRATLPEKRKN
jgi:hypothetical protein